MKLHVAFPGGRDVVGEQEAFVLRNEKLVLWTPGFRDPNPLGLVLSALGMCSGDELQAFCLTREIPVASVGLAVSAAFDMETKRVRDVTVSVLLPAAFPEKYVESCLRAVEHCNVKTHLEEPMAIQVEVQVAE